MTNLSTPTLAGVDLIYLLAGQAQYIHMGRRFRRGGAGVEWSALLLPLGLIAVVIGIAWVVNRYLKLREQRMLDSSQGLFSELCQAHGLDWANQQLLRAVANAHRLSSPIQLFVEPERFDMQCLVKAFENRTAQLAALRGKLFGDSDREATEAN